MLIADLRRESLCLCSCRLDVLCSRPTLRSRSGHRDLLFLLFRTSAVCQACLSRKRVLRLGLLSCKRVVLSDRQSGGVHPTDCFSACSSYATTRLSLLVAKNLGIREPYCIVQNQSSRNLVDFVLKLMHCSAESRRHGIIQGPATPETMSVFLYCLSLVDRHVLQAEPFAMLDVLNSLTHHRRD